VVHKITRPDLDKLCRSICDSLTGTVYKDDGQVQSIELYKQFGTPRAEITVRIFDGPD
jgi:Holliday junction resolvase RusA-like endonuclease